MNIKLTFSNLCARAAMLLLATVISIGAWAEDEDNLKDATISGISSVYIFKNKNITITYKVTYYDQGDERVLMNDEDFKATINEVPVNDDNFTITETGQYTLTITPTATSSYIGKKSFSFNVTYFKTGFASGEENDPFVIANKDDLNLLAQAVNGGDEFEGEYFKVSADIDYGNTEYTPIGGWGIDPVIPMDFGGIFDGDGHTIKGIRVSISGEEGFVGLFGRLGKGAVVKNLTLDDANITGPQYTGGIAGMNYGGKITNCHVTNNVTIHADDATYNSWHGGIAGQNGGNDVNGEISYCTSAAKLTVESGIDSWDFYGGIVGLNRSGSTLDHNLVIGATIPTASSKRSGAIAGSIDNDSGTTPTNGYDNTKYENIKNNYYADCSSEDSKGIGLIPGKSSSYDITGNDGAVPAIALYDSGTKADNNVTTISKNTGTRNVILAGRTLYKDGNWNTICLPFPMTAEQVTNQLAPASLMELDIDGIYETNKKTGFDPTTRTLYLYFKSASTIEAGKPYIIKWDSGNKIVDPTFSGVTVTGAAATGVTIDNNGNYVVTASNSGLKTVEFIGNYKPKTLDANDKSSLYLGTDNTLYYPSKDRSINSFRAYFHVDLGTSAGVRAFVLNFDSEETGIVSLKSEVFSPHSEVWYTIDGRKYSAKPKAKGLYINKGKKVVIK